jgi:hypothetical protein
MKKNLVVALALGVLIVAGPVMAQVKNVNEIGQRLGPPNFQPLGAGDDCDAAATISDLRVTLQIDGTWIGDIATRLSHAGGASNVTIMDRPGVPALGAFGCSGDDMDAILHDGAGGGSVENQCAAAVPTIAGEFTPAPDALAAFDGESLSGDWTLNVSDNAGADLHSLLNWCLAEGTGGTCCFAGGAVPDGNPAGANFNATIGGGDDGGGGTGTPATNTWGVMALIALFMAVSVFFLRKRATQA